MSEQALYRAIREEQLPKAAIIRIGTRIRIVPAALQMPLSPEDEGEGKAQRCSNETQAETGESR
jgi:hypothetical protein